MPGTICCSFSHARAKSTAPPKLKLCLPFCQFSVSLEAVGIRAAPARGVGRVPVREADVRVEVDRVPALVVEALRDPLLVVLPKYDAPPRVVPPRNSLTMVLDRVERSVTE